MNTQAPLKTSDLANKVIDKFMAATGFFSLVWIMAFLLVAMLDK